MLKRKLFGFFFVIVTLCLLITSCKKVNKNLIFNYLYFIIAYNKNKKGAICTFNLEVC